MEHSAKPWVGLNWIRHWIYRVQIFECVSLGIYIVYVCTKYYTIDID